MGFSQKQVAQLLGHKNPGTISNYERGLTLPPLLTAMCLEIIYRVPVAFIYGDLYDALREQIRTQEEKLKAPHQAILF